MKKLAIFIILSFSFSSCLSIGRNVYATGGKIITKDGTELEYGKSKVFRGHSYLIIKENNIIHKIKNENIKYMSINKVYGETGYNWCLPECE